MRGPCIHCGESGYRPGLDDRIPSGVIVARTTFRLCRNCGELSVAEPGGLTRVPTAGELFMLHMSCWADELDKIQRVLRRLHERACSKAKGGVP